jgi:hypothetical protein
MTRSAQLRVSSLGQLAISSALDPLANQLTTHRDAAERAVTR